MLINRHEGCWGLVLWKKGNKFVQLWRCPKNYEIKRHSHNDEDIELMFIKGTGAVFYRLIEGVEEFMEMNLMDIFRTFTVPAGTPHWFSVSKKPLWFINFSTFKDGKKPRSAAKDFHLT